MILFMRIKVKFIQIRIVNGLSHLTQIINESD